MPPNPREISGLIKNRPSPLLWGAVILAGVLWYLAFDDSWGNFWYKISPSAVILALVALILRPGIWRELRFDKRALIWGLVSAAVLYFIFWLGREISLAWFGFAQQQIQGIYHQGQGTPMWLIALLLFFVTGPAEEIFWRGFLQKTLQGAYGGFMGWLLATALYTAVHICTFNFMLVGAAAVAGAFWGLLYWRLGYLGPLVISHAVWTMVVFAVFPLH